MGVSHVVCGCVLALVLLLTASEAFSVHRRSVSPQELVALQNILDILDEYPHLKGILSSSDDFGQSQYPNSPVYIPEKRGSLDDLIEKLTRLAGNRSEGGRARPLRFGPGRK